MLSVKSTQAANESPDAVGFIVTLLIRFPEITTILSHPADGTLDLSFVVNDAIDTDAKRSFRDELLEHIVSLHELNREMHDVIEVSYEACDRMTFVHVLRDVRTMTREELLLLTTLFSQRFENKLIKSPPSDEMMEDDYGTQDEFVEYALEALRDSSQQKSLVGFREEKRVLVYFLSSRKKTKKAKARARS